MGKKRFVNTRETEGEELTMSQEAIANGKKLASQVRKVLESETDKENLDLLEYDIFAIVYAMMDMPNVASLWAKACDEYVVAAYQLAHELARGLQEIEEKKSSGTKTKAETTFDLIQPEITNTLLDQRDLVTKSLTMNLLTPIAIYKAQVEPTAKLYLYQVVGNDKVELTGNKEEYWNNHLDTLERVYDSESDEDDDDDNISQTSQSQLYSSDDEAEVTKIKPPFNNELQDEIAVQGYEDNPPQSPEIDDCHHDLVDEVGLNQEETPATESEEPSKKRRGKLAETLENDTKAPLSKPWASLECHSIESNHVEAKRRKLVKQTKGQNQAKKGKKGTNIGLRAAENVINEIAKGTKKRPGKISQVQLDEDAVIEPCTKENDQVESENHEDDCDDIQFNGPEELPDSSFADNEDYDNFDEMLNKKTEHNLKKLLKGKEDTIEASKHMYQQILAWHSKMSQMLKSTLGELNVRKHEIEILQMFDVKPCESPGNTQPQSEESVEEISPSDTCDSKKASFRLISTGKSKFEVSRLFVTTLMMINSGNVDITRVESQSSKETTCPVIKDFELSLRSNVLQHTEINELMKQTIQGNKKLSSSARKSKVSTPKTSDSTRPQPRKQKRNESRDNTQESKKRPSGRKARKISSDSSDSDSVAPSLSSSRGVS